MRRKRLISGALAVAAIGAMSTASAIAADTTTGSTAPSAVTSTLSQAASPAYTQHKVCGTYVCIIVQTDDSIANNYVHDVTVELASGATTGNTSSWGVDSVLRESNNGSPKDFYVGYKVDAGKCVYGQITSYGNSGCWTAP